MTEKKEDAKKEKSIEDKLVETHSKFLETIREVYPLAVLGSLCIAISAFTQQSFPQAQIYALTGASLFLIAFVSSFASKILTSYVTVVSSYISTVLGVLMLFLVILEFGKTIPMVNKTMSIIPVLIIAFIITSLCYVQGRRISKTKNRFIRLSFLTSIIFYVVFIIIVIFLAIVALIEADFPSNDVFTAVAFPSLVIALIFSFIAIFFINKERKKDNKSSNEQSVKALKD